LHVGESNLRNWIQAVAAHGAQAFAPLSLRTDVDVELRRLLEEVRILLLEKDILKKAATYFTKENE
jgi:transposase-like protein